MIATDLPLITGLHMRLQRKIDVPCGVCGQSVVMIRKGDGPHVASLHCASCRRHRGWLSTAIADLLVEMIRHFGRPSEAITIRNPEFAQANATALWVHAGSQCQHPEPVMAGALNVTRN